MPLRTHWVGGHCQIVHSLRSGYDTRGQLSTMARRGSPRLATARRAARHGSLAAICHMPQDLNALQLWYVTIRDNRTCGIFYCMIRLLPCQPQTRHEVRSTPWRRWVRTRYA
eukprot:588720-Prymnesium_polylepis.1